MEIVGAPIDVGIDISEPGFTENEVVFLQRVDERVEVFRIRVALEVDGSSVFGDGEGTVGKDNGNGGTGMNRDGVLFLK